MEGIEFFILKNHFESFYYTKILTLLKIKKTTKTNIARLQQSYDTPVVASTVY
jgi:hypothetical protein